MCSGHQLLLHGDSLLGFARSGQLLRTEALLGIGLQFRMGGDAQLRLGSSSVELFKGSTIGWINTGMPARHPFSIKTRLATASIQGTTVFIAYTDSQLKISTWEGKVLVTT